MISSIAYCFSLLMELLTKIKLFIAFLIGVKRGMILDSLENKKLDLSAFSTKTAYRYCGLTPFNDGTLHKLDLYKPIHINGIYRHGTRASSLKDVKRARHLHARLLSSESVMLPSGFLDYPVPFANEMDRGLLPRGLEELHSLRRRILGSNRLMASNSTPVRHQGQFSVPVCFATLVNLTPLNAQNTWDAESHLNTLPKTTQIADRFTRLFESCKRYARKIGENKPALEEHFKFTDDAEMKEALKEIMSRHRLPTPRFSTDTSSDIYIMFCICSYEVAMFSNDQSLWCGFLRKNYQPVLEYILDLKNVSAVHIQWPCRGLDPGHLTCDASVLPIFHQSTFDPSEFSRLNRRTSSRLSSEIGVPDPSKDDPLQTIEQRSKTLICISFTKLHVHLLLERVFLNFSGYSLTVTQIQANATKRLHQFLNTIHFSRDGKLIYEKTCYSHVSSVVSTVTPVTLGNLV
ncbi:PHOsphatase [Clonorchis sinensis]|uniref:PHOsphatase n=1 Tax=Clonorchis sinensis TaxID=79923 RepID=A0A419QEC1_CLOSI|nr:PHOsphatase [Clonorchis sinensis]